MLSSRYMFNLVLTWFSVMFTTGMLLFVFLWWKELKKEYDTDKSLVLAWTTVAVFLVGGRSVFGVLHWQEIGFDLNYWFAWWSWPGFSWMGAYLCGVVWTAVWAFVGKWRWFVVSEAGTMPFLVWWLLLLFGRLLSETSTRLILGFGLGLGVYILTVVVKDKYRSFRWYPSGKRGFLFIWANGLSFLGLILLNVGTYGLEKRGELIVSILCVLLTLVGFVWLAEVVRPKPKASITLKKNEKRYIIFPRLNFLFKKRRKEIPYEQDTLKKKES